MLAKSIKKTSRGGRGFQNYLADSFLLQIW